MKIGRIDSELPKIIVTEFPSLHAADIEGLLRSLRDVLGYVGREGLKKISDRIGAVK